jgi:hypothetical protein
MRLRIEPEPTPQEAEAIAAAIETLLGRYGHGGHTGERSVELRFNDIGGDDTFQRDYTWRGLARIEALNPGV